MDLRELMASPGLGIEPSPGLDQRVRAKARRVRLRRRVAGAALGIVAVTAAVPLVPRLVSRPGPGLAAAPAPDYGIRSATSDVVLLEQLNGASIVAWFEDEELCTSAIRVKRTRYCAQAVNPLTPDALPLVLAPDHLLRVDDREVAAGLLRDDVARVRLTLQRGRPLVASIRRGEAFPLAVFFAELPKGGVVRSVEAFGADGGLLGRHLVAPARR